MTWHSLSCIDVLLSLFMLLGNRWPCWSREVGPDVLQRSLPATTSLWLCDLPVTHRDTLFLFRSRSSHTAREAGRLLFWCFFSTSFQVPVKDPSTWFHPAKCACSSMHPGVLVLWDTTWLGWKPRACPPSHPSYKCTWYEVLNVDNLITYS